MGNFLGDIGSFFSGGADDAAIRAGQMKAEGYKQAAAAIGEGETKALGYAGEATGRFEPIYKTGTSALARLGDLYGLNGADAAKTAMGTFMTSPGYDFRVSEGTKALDRGAASKGNLYSGAAGKALVRYGQNVGTDEFGKWTAGITNLAGYSTPSAQGLATADLAKSNIATGAASGKAAALIGQNDALAGGEIGAANARTAGINSAFQLGGRLVSMATGMPMGFGDSSGNPGSMAYGSNPFTPSGGRNPAYA